MQITDEDRIVEVTSRRLEHFNEFLGEKGAHFVEDEEFSSYFSIPYLLTSEQDETESLNHVFEKDWIDALFDSLDFEIQDMCKSQNIFLELFFTVFR